jgi:hypothetical protein
LEAAAKADPSILIAAENLKEKIPSLSKTLIDSHPHIGHSEPGPAQGYIKNNKFRLLAKKLDDGSLIQPTDEARKSVAKILKKSGYDDTPIRKALSSFDEAPENKRVEVAPGLEIVKWTIHRLEKDLSRAQTMDPLIPAKIAYEFLACHVGSAIYNDLPNLAQVRASINTNQMNPNAIRIERLSSNKYEPFHGICFEGNDPYAKVQIRLFGWLAFRVHFRLLSISGPRFVYTHRLDTNEERIDADNESSNKSLKRGG